MAKEPPGIDFEKETERIVSFIRKVVQGASADGIVIGLSGGIDSSVVGALCVRAMGKSKILVLLLPSDHTPTQDVKDALGLAETWGVRLAKVPISGIVEELRSSAKIRGTNIARANIEARIRMTILYYYANTLGFLVAGTGDRSESLIGYYTKFGDGGVDLLPIAHLYKTQVRELGTYLGLPMSVVKKPASPQLWPGHEASDEIPADYDKLDVVLHRIFDLGLSPGDAVSGAGVPVSVAEKVLEIHRRTNHKRETPPSLA